MPNLDALSISEIVLQLLYAMSIVDVVGFDVKCSWYFNAYCHPTA